MASSARWTQAALDELQARANAPKRSKFAAVKTEQAGIKFDSKKEAKRWLQLEQLQKAGIISELQRQVSFVLAPAVHLDGEPRQKPAIRYVSDFSYQQNGQLVVEDCKSAPTRKLPAYRIKKHLMATVLGLQIKEV